MTDWQPIETAPKDDVILVFFEEDDDVSYTISSAGWNKSKWCSAETGMGAVATHWMPLPDPPLSSMGES